MLPAPFYFILKSYLIDRQFYVNINDENSNFGIIKSGVPQGSVLGPVLYTIFTSDMPSMDGITICTYADDTAILASNESPTQASNIVQQEIDLIHNWLQNWNIKINAEKSIHVTFTLRKEDCPPIFLNGTRIPKQNKVKYLGLHLDRRLTWKDHIKMKREQLNMKTKKMYWLLGPKSELNLENKVVLYKTILKPVLDILCGTSSDSNIEILRRYSQKL